MLSNYRPSHPAFFVEFPNDDVGPFATRELAEMYAELECGRDWPSECQVFTSDEGGEPFVAMACRMVESRDESFHFLTASFGRLPY